LEYVLNWSMF